MVVAPCLGPKPAEVTVGCPGVRRAGGGLMQS